MMFARLHGFRLNAVVALARRASLKGLACLLILSSAALGLSEASATTITWGNTGSAFATGANWVGSIAPLTTDQASFPAAGSRVNPLIGNSTVDSIVVDNSSGNYNLLRAASGNTLTITPTVTHAASPSSRGLSVNSGVTTLGTLATPGKVTMGADQTWDIVGDLTVYGGNTTNAFTNNAFRLTKTGGGTFTFNNQTTGGGAGAGPYGGSIGAMTINGGTYTGVNAALNLQAGGTGTSAALVMAGNTTASAAILDLQTGDQTIKFSGTSGTATLAVAQKSSGAAARTLNFEIDNGTAAIDMLVGGVYQYAPSGFAVNMVKTGAGTMRLDTGAGNYTGTTTLAKGQILVGNNALNSTAGAFGNSATALIVGVTGTTVAADNLSLLIDGGNFNIGRDITVNNFNSSGTTTLGINTAHSGIFSGQTALGNHALQITAASGGTVNFTGAIVNGTGSAANSVTKTGTGTAIFSTANTYGGGTTVGAGSLLVNNTTGSGTGSGAVTVQNTGTLGGNGSISGSLTVQGGGHVAPGQSAGILSVGGNVNFNSGSNFDVEIGGLTPGVGGYDRLAVTGSATLGGSINITVTTGLFPAYNDQIILLTASSVTGEFSNATNGQFIQMDANLVAQIFYLSNSVLLTNFSVPEPSSFMLLGLGLVGMLRAQRRRQRVSVQG